MTTTSPPGRSDPDLPGLLPGLLLAERPDEPQHPAVVRRRSVRDWIVDVALFLIAAGIGAATLAEEVGRGDGFTAWRVTDLVIGIVVCFSLWFRRRWPIQLAIAATVAAASVSTSGGAALVMLFTVAVHRRFPAAVAIAVANIFSAAVYYWIHPPSDSWTVSFVFATLVFVVAVIWGMFVRARRQLVVSLRERARQAESEAQLRVEQAQQRERQRIAREMHDVLAHRLSLLSVHANALAYRRDAPAEDVARGSNIIRESAHQALEDLREIIGVLRTPSAHPLTEDEPQPTIGDIAALVDESRRAGMRVAVDDWRDDAEAPLQPTVDRCAYRVVQEGLTNARKHAPGAAVSIAFAGTPGDALTINVRNGAPTEIVPADPIPGSGTGLVGLNERVSLAGGTLTSGPTADGGFALTADLPWPS